MPRLRKHPDLVLLSEFEDEYDTRRMWLCGAIMLAVVAVAALTPLPIVLTALAGVVLMAVTGCVVKEDLSAGVPWDIIFMLAGVIPLGIAMTKSGAAGWLGDLLAGVAAGWPPLVVLLVLYVLTTLLTEVVSNNASVVILIPVAAALSAGLGIPLIALALTVMFAASTSFLSPVGYQTNAMVFGTGVYRFTDFAKVGGPLNVILAGSPAPRSGSSGCGDRSWSSRLSRSCISVDCEGAAVPSARCRVGSCRSVSPSAAARHRAPPQPRSLRPSRRGVPLPSLHGG